MSLVISLAVFSLLASHITIEMKKSQEFPFEETITITRWSEDMLEKREDEDEDCFRK